MAKVAKRVAKATEAFAGKANISVEDAVKLIKVCRWLLRKFLS